MRHTSQALAASATIAATGCAPPPEAGYVQIAPVPAPTESYIRPPTEPFDRSAYAIKLPQMRSFSAVPGEAGYLFDGGDYGFESLSFILTQTQPGGGPPLHKHDVEEAHVVYSGLAEYVIGERRFKVEGPYVVRIPARTPHTFVNGGARPMNVTGVFPAKQHSYTELGPNPLVENPR